jgi:DNA protecting protein DprA
VVSHPHEGANAAAARDLQAARVLRLLDAPSLGPRRVLNLLRQYRAPESVEEVITLGNSPENLKSFLDTTSIELYMNSLIRTRELGGDYLLWNDPNYPANLMLWNGRPPVLFFKGDISSLDRRSLALVGRVDPTAEGRDAANRFARMCVSAGITVISGLAKGIDAASHRAALETPSGTTYAVLGHGLDYSYPKENLELYQRIPEAGALVSQFRTGAGPQRWTFPARNEVMCTLALGTVIIEGKTGCGSIIQADFSFKHGRPVFVLSRNLRGPDSSWAQELVRRGAHVVEQFDQVIEIVDSTMEDLSPRMRQSSETPTLFEAEQERSPNNGTESIPVALFDLDGVVIDSRAATAAALADLATERLGRHVSPDEVSPRGKPHEALAAVGVRNAYTVYQQGYDTALARHADRINVFLPVVEALPRLREHGIRIGAVTAQPARRLRIILPEDIAELFDVILAYNDTMGRKEVGITKALQRLGGTAKHCVYVGDQTTDLEAARKAGVVGIAVLWGFTDESSLRCWAPDILVGKPEDLISAIEAALLIRQFASFGCPFNA